MQPKTTRVTAAVCALVLAGCGGSGSNSSAPAQSLPEIYVANGSETRQVVMVEFDRGLKHLTIGAEDTFEFTFDGTDFTRVGWSPIDTYEISAKAFGSDTIACRATLEVSNEMVDEICTLTVADEGGCVIETRAENGACEVSLHIS